MRGRLLAVSDIHGCRDKFALALLKSGLIDPDINWTGKDCTLIILGDVIDRGSDSKGVVNLILNIKRQADRIGGSVITLMGNHEKMIIDAAKHKNPNTRQAWFNCWMDNGGYQCVESYKEVIESVDPDGYCEMWSPKNPEIIVKYHREYFDNLLPFIILNDTLFVHAGVDPRSNLEELTKGLQICNNGLTPLWIRDQFYNYPHKEFIDSYKVKKIVFGHTPVTRYAKKNIDEMMKPEEFLGGKLLGIDTGGNYPLGSVTIVEFDNHQNWEVVASY